MKRVFILFVLLNLGVFIGILFSWFLYCGQWELAASDIFLGFVFWPILLLMAWGRLAHGLGDYGAVTITCMAIGAFMLILIPFLPWRLKYVFIVVSMALVNLKAMDSLLLMMSV